MQEQYLKIKELVLDEVHKGHSLNDKLVQLTKTHIKPEFYEFFVSGILSNRCFDYEYDYFGMLLTDTEIYRGSITQYYEQQCATKHSNTKLCQHLLDEEVVAHSQGQLGWFFKSLYNSCEEIETSACIEKLPWQPNCVHGIFDKIGQYLTTETPTIIEAGAFDGIDSLQMKKKWPRSSHWAFEPICDIYKEAKVKTCKLSGYSLFQKALYSKNTQFYIEHEKHRMLMPEGSVTYMQEKDAIAEKIDFITIDSFVEKEGIKKVDFLFLDTEGSENHVLQGASKTLCGVEVVYIELNFFTKKGWAKFDEINNILESFQFKLIALYNNNNSITVDIKYYAKAQCNGIYIKSK
jgi:FkbM family methyltransferase